MQYEPIANNNKQKGLLHTEWVQYSRRTPSGWKHIVLACPLAQCTAGDKMLHHVLKVHKNTHERKCMHIDECEQQVEHTIAVSKSHRNCFQCGAVSRQVYPFETLIILLTSSCSFLLHTQFTSHGRTSASVFSISFWPVPWRNARRVTKRCVMY